LVAAGVLPPMSAYPTTIVAATAAVVRVLLIGPPGRRFYTRRGGPMSKTLTTAAVAATMESCSSVLQGDDSTRGGDREAVAAHFSPGPLDGWFSWTAAGLRIARFPCMRTRRMWATFGVVLSIVAFVALSPLGRE